jgi:hypothetical protein
LRQAIGGYIRRHHLALLALFVALGGVSYAAANLPKNSVGARQIKTGAVKGPELKNNAVRGADVNEGSLAKVPQASFADTAGTATTAASVAGASPEIFARIKDTGAAGDVLESDSKGVTDSNVSYADSGDTTCFHGLAFQPRGGQVTVDYFDTSIPNVPHLGLGPTAGCPTGTQAFVWVGTPSSPGLQSLFVLFYR